MWVLKVEAYDFLQYFEEEGDKLNRLDSVLGGRGRLSEFELTQLKLAEDLGASISGMEELDVEADQLEKAQGGVLEWLDGGEKIDSEAEHSYEKPQADNVISFSEAQRHEIDTGATAAMAARAEADRIIAQAKFEAEELMKNTAYSASQIIESAQRSAEETAEAAREIGFQEGFKAGKEEGLEASKGDYEQSLKDTFGKLINEIYLATVQIEDKKREAIKMYLPQLRDLSIGVGEKIIHTSLKSSGKVIERMILSAVETTGYHQWAKIILSVEDAQRMYEAKIDIAKSMKNISDRVKIEVLDSVLPGTCYIELPNQVIDAGLETQMQNIRNTVQKIKL